MKSIISYLLPKKKQAPTLFALIIWILLFEIWNLKSKQKMIRLSIGATAEFMSSYRSSTFYFTTKQISEKGETSFGKGAPFSLLAQRSSEVILRPASFNEPIKVPLRIATSTGVEQCAYNPEFTSDQVNLMQNVVRTRMPPPGFEPVTNGPVIDTDMTRIAHPIMDNLCLSLKSMSPGTMAAYQNKLSTQGIKQKQIANGTETTKEPVKTKIAYYINPQYLTKTFCENVVSAFKSLSVVVDASYLLERHLNEHVMYRLTVEYLDAHFGETPPVAPFPTNTTQQEVHYHFQQPTTTTLASKVVNTKVMLW